MNNTNDTPHILIVDTSYYEEISTELRTAVVEELEKDGCSHEIVKVPGAFELPVAIKFASDRKDGRPFDGYIALGVVIRGETSHYDYVCAESSRKLQDLAVDYNLAIGYGVLTVENEEQAWERARRDKKNRGGYVARACLDMIKVKNQFIAGHS